MNRTNKKIPLIIQLFLAAILALCIGLGSAGADTTSGYDGNAGFGMGTVGTLGSDPIGIDPQVYLTTWNFNNLAPAQRSKVYRETVLEDGTLLREYWIEAVGRDIEIAPGVTFPAWTYSGQVPGPTIRATEGDIVRVHFSNMGTRPHTMHFHGYHPAGMDGSMPEDYVFPGESFVYEFEAAPYGLHLYHCHSTPLTQHIHKGLYGVYIVDPIAPR
ncbi:MAG: multicopper oxidase domain-containing protein, partial [Spirochaetales bacterium]|nr:multicopper oxidase domain-containing protein [Spirochaetales bacterium]